LVFDDWRFEVIEMEGRRLAAILASIEGHKCHFFPEKLLW